MAVVTEVSAVKADVEGDVAAKAALVINVCITMLFARYVAEPELFR